MRFLKTFVLAAAIWASLGPGAVLAQNLVTNGSFEDTSATFVNNG